MPYTACVAGGGPAGPVLGERYEHRTHDEHEQHDEQHNEQHGERYEQPDTAALVQRAATGDQLAWEQLVDQYTRLVFAVTRSFRLSDSDASDVSQTAWLRLLEHIDRIDPARVGAWLVVTTRRECLRIIALRKRVVLSYEDDAFEGVAGIQPDPDEALLADERALDVRRALDTLPERWQQLLGMLMADPPLPYAVISETLGLPIGSIGPMRGRCLDKLRVLLDA
jgi:RNA polymerase sigma factor (sigma-70 family)